MSCSVQGFRNDSTRFRFARLSVGFMLESSHITSPCHWRWRRALRAARAARAVHFVTRSCFSCTISLFFLMSSFFGGGSPLPSFLQTYAAWPNDREGVLERIFKIALLLGPLRWWPHESARGISRSFRRQSKRQHPTSVAASVVLPLFLMYQSRETLAGSILQS